MLPSSLFLSEALGQFSSLGTKYEKKQHCYELLVTVHIADPSIGLEADVNRQISGYVFVGALASVLSIGKPHTRRRPRLHVFVERRELAILHLQVGLPNRQMVSRSSHVRSRFFLISMVCE